MQSPVRFCYAMLLAMLAGCSVIPAADDAQLNVPLGPPQEKFDISGRLALKQANRVDHLRFDWQHASGSDSLTLTSPLGQGVARLVRNAAGASLKLADGREIAARDWQALAHDVFGGELPLDELPEWLRGARSARQGVIDGWWVQVADAVTTACAVPCRQRRLLPRILEASRDEVSVRLVVDERNDADE